MLLVLVDNECIRSRNKIRNAYSKEIFILLKEIFRFVRVCAVVVFNKTLMLTR